MIWLALLVTFIIGYTIGLVNERARCNYDPGAWVDNDWRDDH
jgi:hypothetical protein